MACPKLHNFFMKKVRTYAQDSWEPESMPSALSLLTYSGHKNSTATGTIKRFFKRPLDLVTTTLNLYLGL